ncbi:MAG: conjugal transfer protein TraN [Pseudomonadota bacterium]
MPSITSRDLLLAVYILMAIMSLINPCYAVVGDCIINHDSCIEQAEERIIDGFKVYKDCWRRSVGYQCQNYAKNDCDQFAQDETCQIISSKKHCSQHINKYGNTWCVAYHNHYLCEEVVKHKVKEKRYRIPTFTDGNHGQEAKMICNEKLRCLDGKCFAASYEANNEFGQVTGVLASLKAMQQDMRQMSNNTKIFPGQAKFCTRKFANNCCKPNRGFIDKVGLSKCSDGERELMKLVNEQRCVFVGQSKKGKILKSKRYHYCCFDSELAKELQHQGRQQLGMDFGPASEANCRGFTINELQRLNFDQIKFDFLLNKINHSALWSSNKQGSMQQAAEYTKDVLTTEYSDIANSEERIEQQRQQHSDGSNYEESERDYPTDNFNQQPKPRGRDRSKDKVGL